MTGIWTCSSPTTLISIRSLRRSPATTRTAIARDSDQLRPEGAAALRTILSTDNNGDGTFTEVSSEAGIAKAAAGLRAYCGGRGLQRGWVAGHLRRLRFHPQSLFLNRHDGTFTEIGAIAGTALNEDGVEQSGMGVGIGDTHLSGNIDIFKTHFRGDTNVLYVNRGKGILEDRTLASGWPSKHAT